MKPFQIFKAGKHTDSNGNNLEFTESDIQQIVQVYNPDIHEAPIVIGHPISNAPAYGWVQSLHAVGPSLEATPHQVDPTFAELVQQGRYKKRSASFYLPSSASNPVPGSYYLRHVGFLGAVPPAVKGLKDFEFQEGEDGIVEFSDWEDWEDLQITDIFQSLFQSLREFIIDKFSVEDADRVLPYRMLMRIEAINPAPLTYSESTMTTNANTSETQTTDFAEREAQLQQREAELQQREAELQQRETAFKRRSEVVEFVEGLVKAGKLLPGQKNRAIELLCALDDTRELEFSESEGETPVKETPKALFETLLKAMPKLVEYSEVAGADKPVAPSDPAEIARLVTEYRDAEAARGNTVSFAEGLAHVTRGGK